MNLGQKNSLRIIMLKWAPIIDKALHIMVYCESNRASFRVKDKKIQHGQLQEEKLNR
jgi:hypothetical protein